MSDGLDPTSGLVGVAGAGLIGLGFKAITGLFTRNVGAADKALERIEAQLALLSTEVRSMRDQQRDQRGDLTNMSKEIAVIAATAKGAHERIDALVSPSPMIRARKK